MAEIQVSGILSPFLIPAMLRDRRARAEESAAFTDALSQDRVELLRQAGINPAALSPFSRAPGAPSLQDVAGAVSQAPSQPPLERVLADTEAKRPPVRQRLSTLLDPRFIASPEFDAMVKNMAGEAYSQSPGERRMEGANVVSASPAAPVDLGPGRQLTDPTTGRVIHETPFAPVALGQGGALVDRGTPSAPGANVLHVNPETFAPGSGGGGAGKPVDPILAANRRAQLRSRMRDDVLASEGIVEVAGVGLMDMSSGKPALVSGERLSQINQRVDQRVAEAIGQPAAPTVGTSPAPASSAPTIAPAGAREATDADAQAALDEAGGDAAKAGEILRSRGFSF